MQRYAIWACLLLFCAAPLAAQDNEEDVAPPKAEKPPTASKADKSYAMGVNIARSIAGDEIDIDLDEVIRGLADGLEMKKTRLTDEQLNNAMQALQYEIYTRTLAKLKKQGEDFLAANKKKEGVVALKSGLQYKVIKEGKGKSPKATDTVSTHYHGTLIDGSVFDSSRQRGEPTSFRVDEVIPGWSEALQKMKVGDRWQLFIPADLAYGERGTPDNRILPNSVLVFDIELLGIGEDAPPEDPPADEPPASKKRK